MNPSPASGEPQPEPAQPYALRQVGRRDYLLTVDRDPRSWFLMAGPRDGKKRLWAVARWDGIRGPESFLGRYESLDAAIEASLKDQLM